MNTFALKPIEDVIGKVSFYQIEIDKKGILDEYEDLIKEDKRYMAQFKKIKTWMNHVANNRPVPYKKFHPLKGCKDGHTEYEFKLDDLRIYCFQLKGTGKIVAYGGFKNSQNSDINNFRAVKNKYLESHETGRIN